MGCCACHGALPGGASFRSLEEPGPLQSHRGHSAGGHEAASHGLLGVVAVRTSGPAACESRSAFLRPLPGICVLPESSRIFPSAQLNSCSACQTDWPSPCASRADGDTLEAQAWAHTPEHSPGLAQRSHLRVRNGAHRSLRGVTQPAPLSSSSRFLFMSTFCTTIELLDLFLFSPE